MRTTSSIAFFCRPSKVNKQGLAPLECSVTLSGQRKFLNLPMKFRPEQFNRHRPPQEIVEALDLWRRRIDEYMRMMMKEGMLITPNTLRSVIQDGGIRKQTVGTIMTEFLELTRSRVGVEIRPSVFRKYQLTANFILSYVSPDADVTALTPALVKTIETALKARYEPATVVGYLTRTKCFCKYCVEAGVIQQNPARNLRIVKPVKPITFIPPERLEILLSKSYGGNLQHCLNLLLISCGTGLSYSDLMSFTFNDLLEDEDEGQKYYYLRGKRNKTGRTFQALVLPFAVPILLHYKPLGHLPRISNQRLNKRLKEIAPDLHCHLGRKTFASILYSKNLSPAITAAAIGDTVETTLRYYARLADNSIIKEQINALKKS